jgi:hypothetical protein
MRRLIFHQKVFSDIDQIMSHYETVASPRWPTNSMLNFVVS